MYAPDLLDFVYITDGASTAEDVKACELKILSALKLDQFSISGIFKGFGQGEKPYIQQFS